MTDPLGPLRTLWFRRRDALLGALAGWPLAFVLSAALAPSPHHGLLVLPTLAVVVVGIVVFVRHAGRSFSVPPRSRPWWIAALVVGAVLMMPYYWWRFVWRANR